MQCYATYPTYVYISHIRGLTGTRYRNWWLHKKGGTNFRVHYVCLLLHPLFFFFTVAVCISVQSVQRNVIALRSTYVLVLQGVWSGLFCLCRGRGTLEGED